MNSTQDFIEQMGLLSERSGLPRIAGRMLGFLLLDGRQHALDDLAAQLQVSKASISTNARMLEQRGLISRVSQPGDRRDFYRIVEAPWDQMFEVISEQLRDMHHLFETARASLVLADSASARLALWSDFHAFLIEDFTAKIARWRERNSA